MKTLMTTPVVSLLAAMFALLPATASAKIQAIGQATLVIGNATVFGADGSTRPLERGASVHVGDRLETDAGGHVHLRFVDGGRVSVRPASRLQIESYTPGGHGAQASSGIKFRLDSGVVRSITGQWGEADRERFRLNTPVAAIGVKGTDFIVQTNGKATAATVYSGAIIVSPLSTACAQTLGPCDPAAAQLLTEEMRGQMVAVIQGQIGSPAKAVTLAESTGKNGKNALASASGSEEPAAGKTMQAQQRGIDTLASAGNTPSPVQVKDLFWARYPWAKPYDGDDFSRSFNTAMLRGNTSLAGSGSYSLLSADGPSPAALPANPVLNLRIGHFAGSVIRSAGQTMEPLSLQQGALQIDLARATFETRLDVQGPTLGRDTIQASGELTAKGMLRSQQGNAAVFGGMNPARNEAGYFFIKPIADGQVQGVTLWGP